MTLRTRLNESRLGKYINNSQAGKWFEQTDFALSTEVNLRITKQLASSKGSLDSGLIIASIASILFSPVLIPIGYAIAKYYKKHAPERYNLAKTEYCPHKCNNAIDDLFKGCIEESS